MQEMYLSEKYADLNPTWHEQDSPWKAKQFEGILRKNNIRFDTLCEVGCGTGGILTALAAAFPGTMMTGYEIAPHAFKVAKAKENDMLRFVFGDVTTSTETPYDVMLIADVIEHVEDYIAFLKKIKGCARYKAFHIPLDLSVQSVLRSWPIMNLRADVGHLHYFYKETALAALTDCGYSIVDYRYTASRLELPNQAFSSRVMALPRRLMHAVNPDLAVRVLGGYSLLVLAE